MLAAGLLPACLQIAGHPDAGIPPCCTTACLTTLLSCKLYPEGTPDFTCFAPKYSSQDTDAGPALAEFAAQACTSGNEGAEVACIVRAFPGDACAVVAADAGSGVLQREIDLACPEGFSPGVCDSACVTCKEACEVTDDVCNGACLDAGTFYGCLGCNAVCNQAQTKCEQACLAM
jgi:hypothetical protein